MTLNPKANPSQNFDLDDWKLQLPVNSSGGYTGSYSEVKNLDGYTSQYFYTGPDGAMILSAPVEGATTGGAKYARSELRELAGSSNAAWTLREGGDMTVAMQVDALPKMSDGSAAKIVIGQIHGGDHQLVRLYYDHGTIYWVNGRNEAQVRDAAYEFKDSEGNTPDIDINETFTYSMDVKGHDLTLTLEADGTTYTSDITIGGGWDDNLFYFKAGLYLGTNETTSKGVGQVSILGIDVTHDGSAPVATWPTGKATPDVDVPPAAPLVLLSDNGTKAVLKGTSADDIFSVSHKGTVVNGGPGVDTVRASVGWEMSATVERLELIGPKARWGAGSTSDDTIVGNDVANTLKGDAGNDHLLGDGDDDQLSGDAGDDALNGGSGDDVLVGGGGNDHLVGGSGQDSLAGGEGADDFVFSHVNQSRPGQADVLVDFVSGLDDIDLRGIDANTNLDGNQAFAWGGSGIGHLVLDDGHLIADANGDGRRDFDLDLNSASVSRGDVFL